MLPGRRSCVLTLSLLLRLAGVPVSAEVKLLVHDGLPIVDGVRVNGHGPYRFLVDTGSNVNLIEARLAQKIGLTATFRTELVSSSGMTIVPGSDGIHVELDMARAEGQRFLFMSLEAVQQRSPDVHGVLGQAFLSQFDYELDLRHARLEFRKQEREGTRTRVTMLNGRPLVATSLGDLVLDSASARLVLFGVQPESAYEDRRELRTFTGSQRIGEIFSKLLVIEGRTVWRGNAVAVPHSTERGVGGLLPVNLFRAVYMCNSEGYVVLE